MHLTSQEAEKFTRMQQTLLEISNDLLCPEFVRQKAMRAISMKPDLPPRDGCRYESGGGA